MAASADAEADGRAEFVGVLRALRGMRPIDRDLILLVAWDELTPTEAGHVEPIPETWRTL